MMRRQLIRYAALAVGLSLGMTGCVFSSPDDDTTAAPAPSEDAEVTGDLEVVSFYPEGSPDHDRLRGLADDFEERHPGVTVTLTFGGGQDVPQIEARWRAGDPPEVNYGFFDSGRDDGGDWVTEGKVLALDDVMSRELDGYDSSWEEAILPGVRPLITAEADGSVYGTPESVTTLQFFYNEKIFTEQGIEPPETVDELVDVADQLQAAGITPFTVTGTFLPYMQIYWDYLALRHIGLEGLQSAIDGETELASLPGAADAAADLERLTSDGNLLDGFRGSDFTAAQMSFFQGDAAMILMGSWLVGEMADAIPADFQVGTFAFPAVEGADGDPTGLFGGINVQTVAADSENTAAAVAWLEFIGEKSNQEAYVEATGGISAYVGVPAPEGFDDVTVMLEEGAQFAPSYMGLLALPQEVQNAYQQPIAKLFFGEVDGAGMLAEMSQGLSAATS